MKRIVLICLVLIFNLTGLLAQPSALATQSSIQPFYIGEDGGAYYFAVNGNKVRWVGEHPNNNYCLVFWGKKEGNKISGKWWTIPKYGSEKNGTLEAKLTNGNKIVITNESGGFPTNSLIPTELDADIRAQLPYKKRPAWAAEDLSRLTGAFKAKEKNIICYSRQKGKFVRMYCESEASGGKKPSFAYIFLGEKKEDSKVEGKVYAISKGKQTGSAKATFFINGEKKLSSSSNFNLGSDAWKRIFPNYAKQIDDYINGLSNQNEVLGAYDNLGKNSKGRSLTGETHKYESNGKSCEEQGVQFSRNFLQNTILGYMEVFPGQLIRINKGFKNGQLPTVDNLPRTPLEYTISGSNLNFKDGTTNFSLKNIEYTKYNNKLTQRFEKWNENPNWNPTVGDQSTEFSWSQKQFLLDIGVKYDSPGLGVATSGYYEKKDENYVFNAYTRYDFYEVSVNNVANPSDLFTSTTTLKMVKDVHASPTMRSGYVKSVTYGSIVVVSFEFSSSKSFVEVDAAIDAILKGGPLNAEAKSEYNKAIQNVKIRYFVQGGQWKTLEHSNNIDDIIRQYNEINNSIKNSTPGSGRPISYTVQYLKHNKPAISGLSTNYVEEKCEVKNYITVEVGGNLQAAFFVKDSNGDKIYDKKFKRKEHLKHRIPLEIGVPPYYMQVKVRSSAKVLSSRGDWSLLDEGKVSPGCHYRIGGSSWRKADLDIQECSDDVLNELR